jgi:hypothetical protein
MKISNYFNLNVSQYGLDFIDVDPDQDTKLYLNPHFLNARNDKWSINAYRTIRSFFQHVIDLLTAGKKKEAKKVFAHLSEPKETCLGMSRRGVSGSGVGPEFADKILNSLESSQAVKTGLVRDLEDTVIFVDGVAKDRMSDITANVIRGELLEYTKQQCKNWNIQMEGKKNYLTWDAELKKWTRLVDKALVVSGNEVLLTPKWIASKYQKFNHSRYYGIPVVDYLQDEVEVKTGDRKTKKEIKSDISKYATQYLGYDGFRDIKSFLRDFTQQHPEVFKDFKSTAQDESKPLENWDIGQEVDEPQHLNEVIDYLKDQLDQCDPGREDAEYYHRVVAAMLHMIFYPDLINIDLETDMYSERKRVDITFENASEEGFFSRLINVSKTPATYIYIECKNYSSDPKNKELDQLTGRLSRKHGMFGILTCRKVDNMKNLMRRCTDAYNSKEELIVPMVDEDIKKMINNLKNISSTRPGERAYEEVLTKKAKAVKLGRY